MVRLCSPAPTAMPFVSQCAETTRMVARRLGEVLPRLALADVLGPSGELFVERLGVVEIRLAQRELVEDLAAGLVPRTDLQGRQAREHVELGERQVGDTAEAHGVPERHQVEPAAAALAPRGGAELVAYLAHGDAGLVEELGGER